MKFRSTLISIKEYEVNPKDYHTDNIEKMLRIDRENIEDDPLLFIDDSTWTVQVEEIND